MSNSPLIDSARVKILNGQPPILSAQYVLFWVQQDQRANCNHALEVAIQEANSLNLPLLACFGLCEHFPDANERAFQFLLEGLCDAAEEFAKRGVRLVCGRAPPPDVVCHFARAAACIVTDRGYAKICRTWRKTIVERLPEKRLIQVETNVIVPVEMASRTKEPAAATLRPKIERLLPRFLTPLRQLELKCRSPELSLPADLEEKVFNIKDPRLSLQQLSIDRSVPASDFVGGSCEAHKRLEVFIQKLPRYGNGKSNDPSVQINSFLSPYLHFGQISPLEVALCVKRHREADRIKQFPSAPNSQGDGASAFLEEIIVRRELARNFCFYNEGYDNFDCLPDWAKASLIQHRSDCRKKIYTEQQLSFGQTDDPWWNAAQWEMVATGHMHNYMRMYWCKQLITWMADPIAAFNFAVKLNNKFSLDGRDENGYMGIAWCFGHHDRPFPDRPVFGEVRPMTRTGLESKFKIANYKQLVHRKCRAAVAKEPRLMSLLPNCALGGNDGMSSLFGFCLQQNAVSKKVAQAIADPEPVEILQELAERKIVSTVVDCNDAKKQINQSQEEEASAKRPRLSASPQTGLHRFFQPAPKPSLAVEANLK